MTFRLTHDPIDLSSHESMGLLGTGLLVDIKIHERFTLQSGLGIYSAISGNRGGFFTGGLEMGARYDIHHWLIGLGAFIGGGGGGSAPQGGGLMLRPHVSILRDFRKMKVGLFYSQVKFPNGEIDSDQFGFQLEFPFQEITTDALRSELKDYNLELKKSYIAPTVQLYKPTSGVKDKSGIRFAAGLSLLGIEMGKFIRNHVILFAEAAGAFKGESDGYAELLGGLAYRYPLRNRFGVLAKAAIGSGGGGNVDTAGGILYKVTAGAFYKMSRHLYLTIDFGIVSAPEGAFQATMLKSSIYYKLNLVSPSSRHHRLDPSKLKLGRWTIRMASTRYLSNASLRKSGSNEGAVDLFVIKLDRHFSELLYLTGQAGAAFKGKAGGYATGLFGMGIKRNLTHRFAFYAEALAGAGGGGGIASQRGGIVQPMAGVSYRISSQWDLQILIGRVVALNGELNTTVLDVGLMHRFNTIESIN